MFFWSIFQLLGLILKVISSVWISWLKKIKLKLINANKLKYPCKEILVVNSVKKYCSKKGIIIVTTLPTIK
ncbi:hypothetical protein SCITRI_001943 (plasmid) [Spiroplasma citri]|nr:hypothetical protein SCITRI_001943 [Spiroplasma citri]